MLFDFATLDATEAYRLLVQTIVPRPIAWVLTRNETGAEFNIAPFSYFNMVNAEPPTFILSVGKKEDGVNKDTAHNILRGEDFVVHIAHGALAEQVTKSSAALDYGVSEVAALGLKLSYDLPNTKMPRVLGPKVAFVCKLEKSFSFGVDEHVLFLIQAKHAYVDDEIFTPKANGAPAIDVNKLDPLGRLGGIDYMTLKGVISVPRPK